jgi:hypothetical protein
MQLTLRHHPAPTVPALRGPWARTMSALGAALATMIGIYEY